MRRSYRDWIAWSLVLGVAIIAASEYYVERQTGMSGVQYIEKIVVTAHRPTH
jgi:hypothetical protein